MEPSQFDRLTRVLAAGVSRRTVLLAVGAAALVHVPGSGRAGAWPRAQTETTPTWPAPDPIPLGGGRFLINGDIVSLDLEVVPFVQGTPSVPITVNGNTVFIDTAGLLPGASTPVAGVANATPIGVIEQICGLGDDSEDVELYRGDLGVAKEFVADHQSPVGCLRWNGNLASIFERPGSVNGARFCSGTLITEDLFLTAGHCFSQTPHGWTVPRINGTNDPISRTEIALNMHVEFNYQLDATGNDRVPESFSVIELVEDGLGGLDYAIVRLANNPGLKYGLAAISPADAVQDEMLCIIGHPEGVPKKVEAGPATAVQDITISYDSIDTRGGSSGSGILSNAGSTLIGVHTSGDCESPGGANYGLRISALRAVSPILSNLAARRPVPAAAA